MRGCVVLLVLVLKFLRISVNYILGGMFWFWVFLVLLFLIFDVYMGMGLFMVFLYLRGVKEVILSNVVIWSFMISFLF